MTPYHHQKHARNHGHVCSWSYVVKKSKEFIQLEAFSPFTVLILSWIKSPILVPVASQVQSHGRGAGERTGPLFSVVAYFWFGRNLSEFYAVFVICSFRGVPWACCRDPESVCNILASCCTPGLLNYIHVLQHKAVQRAIIESHSFPAQGRNRASNYFTKRFATPDS